MKTIWKFPLKVDDEQLVTMPAGAVILTAQMQNGVPTIWAEVDPEAWKTTRLICIRGTGHDMKGNEACYIGSIQTEFGTFVWHIYEGLQPFKTGGAQ